MWLGDQKGNLVDWSTQKWVQATGRIVDIAKTPWLSGPIGSTRGIGIDFFDKWASEKQLIVTRCNTGKGLLPSFDGLASPGFDSKKIQPAVANFYERAADYDMDVWSEWSGLTARYLRSFRERIHVFGTERGIVRADHTMSLWGFKCLHLHYRLRKREIRLEMTSSGECKVD